MRASSSVGNFLLVNLAVLFISTSAPLGRVLTMVPPLAIWWRSLFAVVALGIVTKLLKHPFRLPFRQIGLPVFGAGVLMGGHWITYFYSLQVSNIAIALLSLFTYPVFTSWLEPLVLKSPFQPRQLLLGVIGLLGLYFIVPDFDWQSGAGQAVLWGLGSALCFSLRNILLKRQVAGYPGTTLMFYQMIACVVVFLPFLTVWDSAPIAVDWPYLIVLAVITTAAGHTLFVMSFRHFSVSTVSIISSTQPVFGIIMGVIFLGENPPWNTLVGGTLIVGIAIYEGYMGARKKEAKDNEGR
ncbi:MAG TPA: EamA family transporter [Cytophagales bacterium]|nr:EamA family transporter [Cytophagales bacterium]